MITHVPELSGPQRFLAASVCTLAAAWLYLRALAGAVVTDHYNLAPQLLHPWERLTPTVGILALCAASIIAVLPFLRRGVRWQRGAAVCLLVPPACMVLHFLYVVSHAVLWAIRELATP
jgi:hypothetical protein